MKEEVTVMKEQKIEKYKLTLTKRLGFAGPPYYRYELYKGLRHIASAYPPTNDTCFVQFSERNDYYINFNLCSKTKTILTPDKVNLDFKDIDSITIRPYDSIRLKARGVYEAPFYDTIVTKNFDQTKTRRLTAEQVKIFVSKWNNSKATGYEPRDKIYFHYLISVYTKKTKRQFKTLNYYIYESGKWSYETSKDNFFDDLWNKN